MHIDECVVRDAGLAIRSASRSEESNAPSGRAVGSLGEHAAETGGAAIAWFVARQPGVVRFLENRLQGDALAVALHGVRVIETAFEKNDGAPPPRLIRPLLERAEATVRDEANSRTAVRDGCAARQPALVTWLSGFVMDPPVPLDDSRRHRVASCLAAVIYGFDQLTTGRPIP